MKNERVRSLTEGAMIGAIYGVILILIRFLLRSADSIMYYLLPIPIMIYTVKRGCRDGAILLASLVGLSFLIVTDPLYVLPLLIPNYIIGYVAGVLEKYTKLKLVIYLIVFSLCLGVNYLSLWTYLKLTGVGYFDSIYSMYDWFSKVFNISNELFKKTVDICIPAVMVLDSVCKLVIIYMVFDVVCYRLKIKEDMTKENILRLRYNKWFSIVYLISFALLFPIAFWVLNDGSSLCIVISSIVIAINTVLSIYLIYQYVFYISLYFSTMGKRTAGIILAILGLLIFPIGIIGGIISNIKKW